MLRIKFLPVKAQRAVAAWLDLVPRKQYETTLFVAIGFSVEPDTKLGLVVKFHRTFSDYSK